MTTKVTFLKYNHFNEVSKVLKFVYIFTNEINSFAINSETGEIYLNLEYHELGCELKIPFINPYELEKLRAV